MLLGVNANHVPAIDPIRPQDGLSRGKDLGIPAGRVKYYRCIGKIQLTVSTPDTARLTRNYPS